MINDLLAASYSENPYQEYDLIRERSVCYYDSQTGSYVVSGYAEVLQILKQGRTSAFYTIWEDQCITEDLKVHNFNPFKVGDTAIPPGMPALSAAIPVIEENIDNLLRRITGTLEFDIIHQFSALLPFGIFADLTGLSRTDIPRFQQWYTTHMEALTNLEVNPEVALNSERSQAEMHQHLNRVAEFQDGKSPLVQWTRLGENRDSAIGALLMNGGMHFQQGFARYMYFLATADEGLKDKALIDDQVALAIYQEAHRAVAPRPLLVMRNHQEVTVAGVDIPAGSKITLLITAANHDPSFFMEELGDIVPQGNLVLSGVLQPLASSYYAYQLYSARLSSLSAIIAARKIFSSYRELHFSTVNNITKAQSLVARLEKA